MRNKQNRGEIQKGQFSHEGMTWQTKNFEESGRLLRTEKGRSKIRRDWAPWDIPVSIIGYLLVFRGRNPQAGDVL